MMLGLGATTTPTTTATSPPATATPTFTDGLSLWKSPSNALQAVGTVLSNSTQAFSGTNLPVALGILTPPIALVAILLSMGGKK